MTTYDHPAPITAPTVELVVRRESRADEIGDLAEPPGPAANGGPDLGGRIPSVLEALRRHLDADRLTNVGFPSTFDFDYRPLFEFFNDVLNNVGDPFGSSAFPAHTKPLEREVVGFFADLLHVPEGDRWGYVTTGGTEGNEYGLLQARTLFPDGVVYFSEAAHYSVGKLVDKLRMPAIVVRADDRGCLSYRDLRSAVRARRDRPAIVVASVGTTMTEAVDDVTIIRQVLNDVPVRRSYIHADAALSGLPLGLLPASDRPGFDLADGADSVSISGHKFLGCPFPAGLILCRRSVKDRIGGPVELVGSPDTTLGGPRSGHAPLVLWYAINTHGVEGLRRRAQRCRAVAEYAVHRLDLIGWPAWRHPHALTVVLDTPPDEVRIKWRLASTGGRSHIVCVPGVSADQIDSLVQDLASARGGGATAGLAAPTVPAG